MFPNSPNNPSQYPPPAPAPRRRFRLFRTFSRAVVATLGVIVALIVVIVVVASVASSGGKSGGKHKVAASASSSTSAAPAAAGPTLNAAQQTFIGDMRSKYGFNSGVQDQDLITFGQGVCDQRHNGSGQAPTAQLAGQSFTHVNKSDAYNMTRTAESDLCPAWLPAKKWHVIASGTVTGMGNSSQFTVKAYGNSRLKVTYQYSGNSTGFGGDNYTADLMSNSDDQSLANDIAVSGGHTTFVYPDFSFGGSRTYHLNIGLADSTTVTTYSISQRY